MENPPEQDFAQCRADWIKQKAAELEAALCQAQDEQEMQRIWLDLEPLQAWLKQNGDKT